MNPLNSNLKTSDQTSIRNAEVLLDEISVLEDGIAAKEASMSFEKFCEYVIKDEHTGNKIKLAEIHKSWIHHIGFCNKHNLHSLILAPMGHGKTQIFSVAMPLYLLGKNPRSRIKLVCLSDDQAKERVDAIKTYIEDDEDLQKVFPGLKKSDRVWSKHKISVDTTSDGGKRTYAKDVSVDGKGVTTTGIGGRCDYLLVDDIFDYKTAVIQPSTRSQIINMLNSVWITRLEAGSYANIIMTRWHQEDLAGVVLASPDLRKRYGVLIQAITNTYDAIDLTVYLPEGLENDYKECINGFEISKT